MNAEDNPNAAALLRAHLTEVLRWSSEGEIEVAEIAAGALGMATPILFGVVAGHVEPGAVAAIGSLAVGRVDMATRFRQHLRSETQAVSPVIYAAILAALCAGHGWFTDVALILLLAGAALLGSFSVNAAVHTTRFNLFLLIVSAMTASSEPLALHKGVTLVALVCAGAVWTSVLSLGFGALVRWHRAVVPPADSAPSSGSFQQRLARWRRGLAKLPSWNYPLRLISCVALAMLMNQIWPGRHLYWVGVTVAILTQRQVDALPARTTQRALGTAIGVVLAAVLLHADLPSWLFVAGVAVLSGARTLLRWRNYLAYSMVMTPLIIMIIDGGRVPTRELLWERLIATLIAAALVNVCNQVTRLLMR